ncbi:hypothetical protein ES692_09620 [Psychroserpens burtonensis]|uniref:Uncharacterized protein n=1 Tax=Psychroserpens burtonensis TaxID=49278 RepID=A0A5C7BE50_9FLAO|nr:hypothetical protein [Psychroserpens burtonensis]TXE17519.1 hypothetical protein ES692_09620 [Psychroserpens burtonensis]
MEEYLNDAIPNLKPFNHTLHYDTLFINKDWVLVNDISKKKSTYTFKDDNILEISRKDHTIKTTWSIDIQNIFSIETEDGMITVKVYFKDDDVLVLNHQNKEKFALFINTTNYTQDLETVEDIKLFLKEKYKQKVTNLIYDHEFYYIEKSKEFGPFTVEELSNKVKKEHISAYCFVRDVNAYDYSNRLRIFDLIKEL